MMHAKKKKTISDQTAGWPSQLGGFPRGISLQMPSNLRLRNWNHSDVPKTCIFVPILPMHNECPDPSIYTNIIIITYIYIIYIDYIVDLAICIWVF